MNCTIVWIVGMNGKASMCQIYEFDGGECGLFKPKKEGYYDVVLKSHEAMQCFYSWVDAGSVASFSAILLPLRFIVEV